MSGAAMVRPSLLRNAWSSALSRGPGYEPQPPGLFDTRRVGDYFTDLRGKTTAPGAARPERLLPAALAQLGLGWWGRMQRGDESAAQPFEVVCDLLARSARDADDGLRWDYHVALPKYGIEPPWCSALAQGQIASVFVRAAIRSGRSAHAGLALAAARPLLSDDSDLVTITPDGPVLEEVPRQSRSHVLNGWIYALWGLWDVEVGLGDEQSGDRFRASVRALRAWIDRYDTGWWTRYSVLPGGADDLAKPFYHRLHVDQVEILNRLTGFAEFTAAAARWRGYDRPANLVRAVVLQGRRSLDARP